MANGSDLDGVQANSPRAFDYARTVALSDGVFAIALTLLVLNISVPTLVSGHHDELGKRLLDRQGEFGAYALSFAVIAFLWVRHHRFFGALTRVDPRMTALNLLYLGFVAFLPYPTRVLSDYGNEPAAAILYATTCAVVVTIAGAMRLYALRGRMVSAPGEGAIADREHWAISPVVFLVSIPVAFASPRAAELCWLGLVVVPALQRKRKRSGPGN